MRYFRSFAILGLLTAFAVALAADPAKNPLKSKTHLTGAPVKESFQTRRHFAVVGADGAELYEVTAIALLSEHEDSNEFLVHDLAADDRFVARAAQSYWNQRRIFEISDPKSKEVLSARVVLPFKSLTRSGVLAEAKTLDLDSVDAVVEIEAGGLFRSAKESEWKDPRNQRVWRHELRTATSPKMLERLERMRGNLLEDQLQLLCSVLASPLLYGRSCGEHDHTTTRALPANCEFDEDFGSPCSESQRIKVRDAEKEQAVLDSY